MNYTIIADDDQSLEIEIGRKPNYHVLIFTGFSTLGCMGVIVSILYEITKYPYKFNEEVIIFLLLLLSAGLYTVKLFLWHLRGKEKVVVNKDELIISRLGTILSVPRKYEISFVINFLSTKNSPYPWWMRIFGIAGGQVEFHYLGAPRYFGQTLSLEQAQEIADLINARISHLYIQ